MQLVEEPKNTTEFRHKKRVFYKSLNDIIKEYESTLIPYLPNLNKQEIEEKLSKQVNFINLIIELEALWPVQFLFLLDEPKKAFGQWLYIFCKSLKYIGKENILKESANKSIYDFIMKDNIEIFKKIKREIRKNQRKKAKIRKNAKLKSKFP